MKTLIQRKPTWTHYLITGGSLLLLFCMGCRPDDGGWPIQFDWVFVNETSHRVEDVSGLFPLEPGEERTHIQRLGSTYDQVDIRINRQENLDSLYPGNWPETSAPCLKFDSQHCVYCVWGFGHKNFDNFEKERLGKRHLRFTYRITENHYDQAEPCEYLLLKLSGESMD